jgi:hypothetical protein
MAAYMNHTNRALALKKKMENQSMAADACRCRQQWR